MKIVYNIYVAVRKLWNAIFGKNGDGSQLAIPGRISGASGDVTVGDGLNLTNNVMKSTVPVVSANPETGEGDPELTGLMIGNSKYKMPGGGTKYLHNIVVNSIISGISLSFALITNNSTKFTSVTEVCNYILANTNKNDVIVASGGGEYLNPSIIYWVTNLLHSGVGAIDVQGAQFYNNSMSYTTLLANLGTHSASVIDTVVEL